MNCKSENIKLFHDKKFLEIVSLTGAFLSLLNDCNSNDPLITLYDCEEFKDFIFLR
jgi:hypothetical protein